ncbi:MAG: hypothetical protein FJZ01_14270 [Candidatus Sericytochromatia bacterium]|nr:hypothetical protein [Candidatus Tanganyikabacteria bacterium]
MDARALAFAALVAPACLALSAPPAAAATGSTAQIMLWRMFQVAPDTARDRHDIAPYLITQHWLTEEFGLYAFYSPIQSAVVRGTYRFKPAGDLGVTLMAGGRWSNIASSLKTFSGSFLEGPEGVIVVGHPLGGGFALSVLGSYAHLFELNPGPTTAPNTGEPKNLSYYGLNLSLPPLAGTTVTVGILGAILNGYQTGQKFHDLGPTLSFSRAF